MMEQGAVRRKYASRVEPREAQRPTLLAARTPQAAGLGNEVLPWVRRRASQACLKGAVAQHPGASRRSIPLFGETEKGKQACPAPSKNRDGGALTI